MSSLARAIVLPLDALPELAAASVPKKGYFGRPRDRFAAALAERGSVLATYGFQGFVLATLLSLLDERGIPLLRSEHEAVAEQLSAARQATYVVLTESLRNQNLAPLSASSFTSSELRRYYEEFNETQAPGVEEAMAEGIRFLATSLAAAAPDKVVLVEIA